MLILNKQEFCSRDNLQQNLHSNSPYGNSIAHLWIPVDTCRCTTYRTTRGYIPPRSHSCWLHKVSIQSCSWPRCTEAGSNIDSRWLRRYRPRWGTDYWNTHLCWLRSFYLDKQNIWTMKQTQNWIKKILNRDKDIFPLCSKAVLTTSQEF